MKVLVIGSGGREHALVWKIARSPLVTQVFCAPGNGGTAECARNVPIEATDIDALKAFARDEAVDLTVVGPEAPLVQGIVDVFEAASLPVFGPSQACARLEGSKAFAKELMRRVGVPTAASVVCDRAADAYAHVRSAAYPLVVKADGLAAGKGVVICHDRQQAEAAIADMMERKVFQQAGDRLLIEEYLTGEEVSLLVLTDGERIVPLAACQDHKAVNDHDAGPNTGGMGAYSPTPIANQALIDTCLDTIVRPVIGGLAAQGTPYRGVLYAGLMITKDGPKVLEFNARFGDPETQVILPRIREDLVPVLAEIAAGRLSRERLSWDERYCISVVLAAGGYPGSYQKGQSISGLAPNSDDAEHLLFHAGTARVNGRLLTAGGRVVSVVALDGSIEGARKKVYAAVQRIHFDRMHYRTDIACKALAHIRGTIA